MFKSKRIWTFLIVLLFLVGCNQNSNPKTEPTVAQTDDEEETTEVEVEEEVYTFPLTGEETSEEPTNRAISVMINNHPDARPQSGLTKADMVYEVLAEGGVTRLLAVFQSEFPEIMGPVRSARPYYIELAKGFDALYLFHGWSPDAQQMIEQGYVDSLNGLFYDGTLFQRATFRKAPHNSYITYEHALQGAEDNGYTMTGAPESFRFLTEDEVVSGNDQTSVTISYSSKSFEVRYEYDQSLARYTRYCGDVQMTDYETNDPILLDNIFIAEMTHTTLDNSGRLAIDLTSGGKALLLQKGKVQEIEWKNIDGRIVPYNNGEEVPLVPGKTWVNIVPSMTNSVQLSDS